MLNWNILLISALEAFVAAAKKLPQEDVYDVVEGYIKISVECAEMFQLLSGEKRPESEVGSSLPGLLKRRKVHATIVLSLRERDVIEISRTFPAF